MKKGLLVLSDIPAWKHSKVASQDLGVSLYFEETQYHPRLRVALILPNYCSQIGSSPSQFLENPTYFLQAAQHPEAES